MTIFTLLLQLGSGAAGGHLASTVVPRINLGWFGNGLAGLVGGGLGGQTLGRAFGTAQTLAGSGPDVGTIICEIVAGGVGGALLVIAVGLARASLSP